MNDDDLMHLLKSMEPSPRIPKNFRREVWTRIAQAEATSAKTRWKMLPSDLLASFTRPLPATATIAAAILLGGWLGAASIPPSEDAKLGYAETISPFLHPNAP